MEATLIHNQERKRAAELRALHMAFDMGAKAVTDNSGKLAFIAKQYADLLLEVIECCEETLLLGELINDKGGHIGEAIQMPELIDIPSLHKRLHLLFNVEAEEDDEEDNIPGRLKRGVVLYSIEPALREIGVAKTPGEIIQIITRRIGHPVPTSTVTNSLTRLVRAGKLKRTSDTTVSLYGLPEWFGGDKLKPQFIDSKEEFQPTEPTKEGTGPIEANIMNSIIDDFGEETDKFLAKYIFTATPPDSGPLPFFNEEEDEKELPF